MRTHRTNVSRVIQFDDPLYDTLLSIVCAQEQHSLQLFLGNPKHPKQLIINTLRDSVKAIPGHLEVNHLANRY